MEAHLAEEAAQRLFSTHIGMSEGDGNLLGKDAAGANKIVSGTRWQEISADIGIVADMSHDIGARTEFLPLNGALRPLTIQGTNEGDVAKVSKGPGNPRAAGRLHDATGRCHDAHLPLHTAKAPGADEESAAGMRCHCHRRQAY